MRDPQIYVYKIPWDTGGAPCVTTGLLSLAICKPAIRRTAKKGDLIFAFGTNSETPANRLVYAAIITNVIDDGKYYKGIKYQRRGDCIYCCGADGKFKLRNDAKFHNDGDARARDLGDPPEYRNASVIISNDFRYFGGRGTDAWKASAPKLKRLIEGMRQGHRVRHASQVREQLIGLKDQIWLADSQRELGKPLHGQMQPCDDPDDETLEIGTRKCSYLRDT